MPTEYPGRASGTYICPNNLAGFLEMLVPLGLAQALMGRPAARAENHPGLCVRWVMLAGIGATLSRGGWLATALSLAGIVRGWLLFQRHYRMKALVLAGGAGGGGATGWCRRCRCCRSGSRMFSTGHIPDDMRFSIWAPAIQMWRDHFWWGTGAGAF